MYKQKRKQRESDSSDSDSESATSISHSVAHHPLATTVANRIQDALDLGLEENLIEILVERLLDELTKNVNNHMYQKMMLKESKTNLFQSTMAPPGLEKPPLQRVSWGQDITTIPASRVPLPDVGSANTPANTPSSSMNGTSMTFMRMN